MQCTFCGGRGFVKRARTVYCTQCPSGKESKSSCAWCCGLEQRQVVEEEPCGHCHGRGVVGEDSYRS
jgi:hypothetical protein